MTDLKVEAADLSQVELRRGAYQIGKQIGVGSTATVYESRDPVTGQPVAVKVGQADSAELLAVDIMRYLTRPPTDKKTLPGRVYNHLIQLVDVGIDKKKLVTVMPLLDYTVAHVLRSGGEPDRSTRIRWVGEMVAAVSYLKDLGLYHLDVKPDNLLLERFDLTGSPKWSQYRVVLADFGLMAYAPRGWAWIGGPAFSAWYRPPEEFDSKAKRYRLDDRRLEATVLDWAVGAAGLEMMTSEIIFGAAPGDEAVYAKIKAFSTPEGQQLASTTYAKLGALEEAFLGMLKPNPAERLGLEKLPSYTGVALPEGVQMGWTEGKASRTGLARAKYLEGNFRLPARVLMLDFVYRYGDLLLDSATTLELGGALEGRVHYFEEEDIVIAAISRLLALDDILFLRRTRFSVAYSDQELSGFLAEASDILKWVSVDPLNARTEDKLIGRSVA